MINYKQWRLLNESLGSFNLGLSQKQNLGVTGSQFSGAELDEMGMKPMYMKPGKGPSPFGHNGPPPGGGDMPPNPDDEDMPPEEEEEDGMPNPDDEDMPEEDEDNPDGEDPSLDPDAEFGDHPEEEEEDGMPNPDEEEEEDGMPHPHKMPHPMGQPHNNHPFMRMMRAEGCGDDMDDDMDDDSDHDDDSDGGEMVKDKKGGKPELSFLQKKQKKLQKKMSSGNTAAKDTKLDKPKNKGKAAPKGDGGVAKGKAPNQKYHDGKMGKEKWMKKCGSGMAVGKKCSKCSKQKKNMKEASYDHYGRPASYDNSDRAFIKSLRNMFGNPHETFSDGMRDFSEDMLLPSPEPKAGEVGYAPQTRVGSDVNAMAENIQHLLKKINELENQLGKR